MNKKTIIFLLGIINLMNIDGSENQKAIATFAGGCFWCMEPPFEKMDGVINVTAGYINGTSKNPTYQDYAQKGHIEAVQVMYDPSLISYSKLVDIFWRNIDPTDSEGQFVDRGKQYRSAIFYHTDEQKKLAQESKKTLEQSKRFPQPIVTEILKASEFYPAEEYHQDYAQKNPIRYKLYRFGSGRDQFLEKYWENSSNLKEEDNSNKWQNFKKPSDSELRKILTPLQYSITQNDETEPPYQNPYWDLKEPGIYVDIISGEPLFSSKDKYDSKTGWPSFTKPVEPETIIEKDDWSLFLGPRTEVRSKYANSHLGHVFNDGPQPTGLRYCINSAALRFIPLKDLEKEGYGKYLKLFESSTTNM